MEVAGKVMLILGNCGEVEGSEESKILGVWSIKRIGSSVQACGKFDMLANKRAKHSSGFQIETITG